MLKLVLGGSGSGKTTLLYARIKARAEAGQRSILLVPEQFTSSTEGRIYRELGDALSGMVDSYSFTSLAEHILSAEGGAAVQTLSDAGRAVLVRRTLEELQDTVQYYYRHRRSAAFCQMAAETIDELKSAGLSGQQLYRLAQGCGSGSGKLTELALILQGYETLLAGTGMDPSDRLELAADRLEAALARGSLPEFLQDRAVFIDEFDTFNAPKKRLLSALLTALPQVTVALCDDGTPLVPGDTGLFAGAKLVAAQLRQLARKSGTEAAAPELLRRDLRHKDAPGLAAVTRLLEGGSAEETQAPEVRLFPAASREEEARCAAAAIRRLMRKGVRCGKIAVVCRDIAKYRAAVRYEFRMADIPLYCDEPTTPEFSAPATAVRALLALLRGADMTEQLTVLAKTGLCALSEEQVCALENYAYTWSPNAAAWRAEFTKNPRGFGENELTDEDRQNLAWAEDARRKLVDAVDTLRGKVKGGNAEQISRAVYFCLKELGAEEQGCADGITVRTGRLDAEGMTALLRGAALCVDATHPYAAEATRNIRAAAAAAGVEYHRLLRPASPLPAGSVVLADAARAAAYLADRPGRVLLATGAKELPAFAALDPARLYPRVLPTLAGIAACEAAGVPHRNILAMQGPFTKELNAALLHQFHIDYMVTKDGGAAGGFAEKAEAAARCGVQLIVLRRPDDEGETADTILQRCRELL